MTSGSVLVGRDVVGDLGDPQVAALVALADRADRDDVRVGRLGRLDLGDHLRVRVVAGVLGREVGGGRRRRRDERRSGRQGEREGEGQGEPDARPQGAVVHAGIIAVRSPGRTSRDGATRDRDPGTAPGNAARERARAPARPGNRCGPPGVLDPNTTGPGGPAATGDR